MKEDIFLMKQKKHNLFSVTTITHSGLVPLVRCENIPALDATFFTALLVHGCPVSAC